jgi:hypothetical protein
MEAHGGFLKIKSVFEEYDQSQNISKSTSERKRMRNIPRWKRNERQRNSDNNYEEGKSWTFSGALMYYLLYRSRLLDQIRTTRLRTGKFWRIQLIRLEASGNARSRFPSCFFFFSSRPLTAPGPP